jgi:hypothetical protein
VEESASPVTVDISPIYIHHESDRTKAGRFTTVTVTVP